MGDGVDRGCFQAILDGLPLAMEATLRDGRRVGIVHAGLPNAEAWSQVRQMEERKPRLWEDMHSLQGSMLWSRTAGHAATYSTLPNARELLETDRNPIFRCDYHDASFPVAGLDLLISGHVALKTNAPIRFGNRLFLDTGAGYPDGCLSMIELESGSWWCVSDSRRDLDTLAYSDRHMLRGNPEILRLSDVQYTEFRQKARDLARLLL